MEPIGELPNRIREFRKARKLNLQHLADRVGCGVTFLSDLERGNRQLSAHWIVRIAKALRVRPADLFYETDGGTCVSTDELAVLDHFRLASSEQKRMIMEIMEVIVGPGRRRATKG